MAYSPKDASPIAIAFMNFFDYVDNTRDLNRVTYQGYRSVGVADETLAMLKGAITEQTLEARAFRVKVQPEIEDDFPTLHAHSILGLWGAVETLVEDLFKAVITLKPELLGNDLFSKPKLPISTFTLVEELRNQEILDAVTNHIASALKLGIGQFESLLKFVDLDGQVTDQVRRAILEAQKIRNVWGHRAGIADEKFMTDNSIAHEYKLGRRVNVGTDQYNRYLNGLSMYASILQARYTQNYDDKGFPELKDWRGYEGTLADLF